MNWCAVIFLPICTFSQIFLMEMQLSKVAIANFFKNSSKPLFRNKNKK